MFFKKKSLGQNFLKSKGVVSHIISASKIKKGDLVLEIGPGQGFLTEDLIEASGNVLSIEKDDRLIEQLQEKFSERVQSGEWRVVHDDVLDFDLNNWTPAFAGATSSSYKVVANIPYYITGQIIKKFLTAKNKPTSMTLMVQKEVAQRICGPASARSFSVAKKESILSLSVKLFGEPKYIKTVKRDKFSPAPKVDSAILLIENISTSPFERKDQEALFFEVVKKAFNSKRKQIGSTLKQHELELQKAKIDLKKRPEDLKLDDWINLVRQIKL
jgi:16S rRNA (adenine1518-N6/adenine1519-N6)-dimethyltransferase